MGAFLKTGAELRDEKLKQYAATKPKSMNYAGTPSEQAKQSIGFALGGMFGDVMAKREIDEQVKAQEEANQKLMSGIDMSTSEGLYAGAQEMGKQGEAEKSQWLIEQGNRMRVFEDAKAKADGDGRESKFVPSKNSEGEVGAMTNLLMAKDKGQHAVLQQILSNDGDRFQRARATALIDQMLTKSKELQHKIYEETGENYPISEIQNLFADGMTYAKGEDGKLIQNESWLPSLMTKGAINLDLAKGVFDQSAQYVLEGLKGGRDPIKSAGAVTGTGRGNPDNAQERDIKPLAPKVQDVGAYTTAIEQINSSLNKGGNLDNESRNALISKRVEIQGLLKEELSNVNRELVSLSKKKALTPEKKNALVERRKQIEKGLGKDKK